MTDPLLPNPSFHPLADSQKYWLNYLDRPDISWGKITPWSEISGEQKDAFAKQIGEWDYINPHSGASPDVSTDASEVATEASEKERDLVSRGVLPSRVVLGALSLMSFVQQLAGMALPFGLSSWQGSPVHPDEGGFFRGGSQAFAKVGALLREFDPGSWRGAAADAGIAANTTLMVLAGQLADRDREMEQLVKDQAECIAHAQLGLGVAQDSLIAAYPCVCYLESNPNTFDIAFYLAITVTGAAVGTGIGLLIDCVVSSDRNASAAGRIHYGDVIGVARQ